MIELITYSKIKTRELGLVITCEALLCTCPHQGIALSRRWGLYSVLAMPIAPLEQLLLIFNLHIIHVNKNKDGEDKILPLKYKERTCKQLKGLFVLVVKLCTVTIDKAKKEVITKKKNWEKLVQVQGRLSSGPNRALQKNSLSMKSILHWQRQGFTSTNGPKCTKTTRTSKFWSIKRNYKQTLFGNQIGNNAMVYDHLPETIFHKNVQISTKTEVFEQDFATRVCEN